MQLCPRVFVVALLLSIGCVPDPAGGTHFEGGSGGTAAATSGAIDSGDAEDTGAAEDTSTSGGEDTGGLGSESSDEGGIFDVGVGDSDGYDLCKVNGELDGTPPCLDQAPAGSFQPAVQWSWSGEDGEDQALATPLVANLTDDNGDGEIDLCDTPDIVVVAYASNGYTADEGHIYVIDGETGQTHFRIDEWVNTLIYPALGDIDGDGLPEIVTATWVNDLTAQGGRLVAFEHDGTLKWISGDLYMNWNSAVTLADLDADGDVEIILRGGVSDHEGNLLWQGPALGTAFSTAADLDADGDLEVVLSRGAWHHDGTPYFEGASGGHPHVADVDDDGLPEVVVIDDGVTIFEHDGTLKVADAQPTRADSRPAAIHDMDGDGTPEIAVGGPDSYSVLELDMTASWTATVDDGSGFSAGTAFDFLGDGTAEAMYADETTLYIFDESGTPYLTAARESWTQFEHPIVADVDNDGSAEIVVVSNAGYDGGSTPAVQVIRDAEDRWVPARRIWNQSSYYVTNVREDGTIPADTPPHWLGLNTFRTQAQIASGAICRPAG